MAFRVAAVALVLLAAGCGSENAMSGQTLPPKVYTSTSSTRALVEGTKIELRFTDDGRLNANAGCNQMQGPVSTNGGKLAVTDLTTTDMACPAEGLGEQDRWLSELLTGKPSWKLDGANLVITGNDAEVVLAERKPATLEGEWAVEGLISTDAVSSLPVGVTAKIRFEEGYVHVTGGCNGGSSKSSSAKPYEVDGQTIKGVGLIMSVKRCGDAEMEVDGAILATLKPDGFTYQIEGDTLTLKNAQGVGLQLRK
ncbi:META domain-containing protein [Lentzea sp. NBRC 102530]|uniref:META domain-containing protein n=1 Tax=Lentzea sp. NBRC 102530 TaxID=3032201 RepID=UPI0024A366EA|nr:META domain-containing protein [Lentzea sp. NBRC 102530]GLY52872.1 hypothetical protein Lesp01_65280 [Lentzea sp. NBRC 102530]